MLTRQKWQAISFSFVALVLFLVGAWTLGWIPLQAKYCEYNPYTEHENCITDQIAIVGIRYLGWFLNFISPAATWIATAVIGAYTIVLARVTGRQARLTRESIDLAREEFIATHRPKIKIHAAEITRREVDNQIFIGASILAFNAGESVAKNVEVRGEIFMGPKFAIDVQRVLVKTFDEVLAGQKLRAEVTSEWQVSDAAAGKRTGIICYCLGWIAYWDESGQRRETGFCFQPEFGADGDRWVSAGKPEHEYDY